MTKSGPLGGGHQKAHVILPKLKRFSTLGASVSVEQLKHFNKCSPYAAAWYRFGPRVLEHTFWHQLSNVHASARSFCVAPLMFGTWIRSCGGKHTATHSLRGGPGNQAPAVRTSRFGPTHRNESQVNRAQSQPRLPTTAATLVGWWSADSVRA